MQPNSTFDPSAGKALIHWREYQLSSKNIAIVTAILVILVGLGYLLDGRSAVPYVEAAAAVALLTPVGLLYARRLLTKCPVAIGPDEMVAPLVGGGEIYIDWSNVHTVAHVHSLVGGSFSLIEFNLLVYRRKGGTARISLPAISGDEYHELWAVLECVAKRHRITLLNDQTHAGFRRIRSLPFC